MKVIIVGGGACGASCATRLRRLDESCEITILERTNEISIANCGLPYYCSNVINDRDRILVSNPKKNKNISTLSELITQAQKNGIKFIACNMSMDVMGIPKEELIDGVEIGGVAKYIAESNNANSNLFI